MTLHRLEPRRPHIEGGGLFFPNAINVSDPGRVMGHLSAADQRNGVDFIKASGTCIVRERDGVRVAASPFEVRARTVVIAAGAHSRNLAARIGDSVPLDTERGYHVEFDTAEAPIERPVCPATKGFYLCPMRGRLRAAGMVELAGLAAPVNPRLLQTLTTNARRIFPELGAPSRTWLGFRPSMPDSVPVIRPSKGVRDVILVFGHGHIGLTLAPRTARSVSAMLAA
jgi:D-amino-acid dehydrogenase